MARKPLNPHFKERDRIITGKDETPRYWGGIYAYQNMSLATLKELDAKGYLDPEDCQNDSPSIRDFIEIMEKYPEITAHGYAVSFERDDYRFAVEGIMGKVEHTEGLLDVVSLCRHADEFDVESLTPSRHVQEGFSFRAWWD